MLYSTESFAYQSLLTGFTPFLRDRLCTHVVTPGKVKVRGGRNAVLHHAAPPPTPSSCECGPGPSGVPPVKPFALPDPFLMPTSDNDISAELPTVDPLRAARGSA